MTFQLRGVDSVEATQGSNVGRLRPEVWPIYLLYPIFDRKCTPLIYLLLINGASFTYVVKTLHPFYLLKITKPGSFRVAKCNLGQVNLEAMLVSSFSSYTGGGPMPLAGAPRDLYTQLLACIFFAKCCCNSLMFSCHFGLWFFPFLPPSWGKGQVSIGR